tara:strand:+ start:285 stop:527 length:243 start_codon:yes stop_codon:yes gene_type:complete
MIDIDKELEWVTAWDKEDRHVGVISKHECVVDVDWVEELLAEVKRLREELRITQSNFSMVRNALANQYPEIEEAIWKVIE